MKKPLLILVSLLFLAALPCLADPITVGETCGQASGGTTCYDLGTNGQIVYNLGFTPESGDVYILDPDGSFSDIASFSEGGFVEYTSSDNGSLAGNGQGTAIINESLNGITSYTANFGMPGYDFTNNQSVTYTFYSSPDGQTPPPVPEPASIFLVGSGILGLTRARRRKMLKA